MTADTHAPSTYPTTHQGIVDFVNEVAELTQPDRIQWCTGSDEEWTELTEALMATGTFTQLNPAIKPNSFYAASDPIDVARVEDRTYICSVDERDAGPTNNWMPPEEMKQLMRGLYAGCMRGRTMYVIPFVMGHLDAEKPMFGIEVTDSAYVTASMRVMSRMGSDVLARMEQLNADFVQAVHSVGHPLADGEADVQWPCNDTKYIVQFPEERTIWSYGSGYGGNALLGKKCYALRIASVMARDEGWLAEHMLILKLTSPAGHGQVHRRRLPERVRQDQPRDAAADHPGWSVETLGDDIAWMRVGADGRLWAVNPEFGLFGVAPGTNEHTNPNAMRTINKGNSVFTNVALTEDGDIWWEGLENPPAKATSWKGEPWTPSWRQSPTSSPATPTAATARRSSSATSSRPSTTTRAACRSTRSSSAVAARPRSRWCSRRATGPTARSSAPPSRRRRRPPRSARSASCAATRWRCCRSSATTPATTSATGSASARTTTPPSCRRSSTSTGSAATRTGGFLWPGFGENSRVLKWVVERMDGQAAAVETPIGYVPTPASLDTDGLDMSEAALEAALEVDVDEWAAEIPQIQEWFEKFGDDLPAVLWTELDGLRARLGTVARPHPPAREGPVRRTGPSSLDRCGIIGPRGQAAG